MTGNIGWIQRKLFMSTGGSNQSLELEVFLFHFILTICNPADLLTESDRKTTYEWKFHYECDHAGKPHERRDPNLSPSKRRKTSNSIKVGCQAKINIFQLVGSDKVIVEHFWKHNGHGKLLSSWFVLLGFVSLSYFPDPETLQNTGRVPLFL